MEAKKDLIHINSLVTVAMALYAALVEQRDSVVCSFVREDIEDPARITK